MQPKESAELTDQTSGRCQTMKELQPAGEKFSLPTFGQFIQAFRIANGMKQTEAATKSGIGVQNWNKLEKDVNRKADGSISALSRETAQKVAKGLGIDEALTLNAAGYCTDETIRRALAAAPYHNLHSVPFSDKLRALEQIRKDMEHLVHQANFILACGSCNGLQDELERLPENS